MTLTRPRIPILVLGVVVPAAVSLVGIAIALFFVRPGDVVVHWAAAGEADGWAPAWTVPLGMTFLMLVGALSFGLGLVATRGEGVSTTQRLLVSFAVGFATLLTTLGLWILIAQRDPDAALPPVSAGLGLAVGAAVALGALAWLFSPAPTAAPTAERIVEALPLHGSERAVWIGRTHLATPAIVAIVAVIVFSLVATALAALVTDGVTGALLLVPAVLLVVLLLTTFWTVRADDDGLTVRSAAGWPRFHVPAAQIQTAGTTDASVVGEFGGWGIRFGRGRRLGVIMRAGEALEVRNRDGGALVVTVHDAATAASVLSAVAERAASR